VTKTCLSPTEAILSWKWSRNVSRWNCWNQFNGIVSTIKDQGFDKWWYSYNYEI